MKLSLVLSVTYDDEIPKSRVLEFVVQLCNRGIPQAKNQPPRKLSENTDIGYLGANENNPTNQMNIPNDGNTDKCSDIDNMDLDMEVISLHIIDDIRSIEPFGLEVKDELQATYCDPLLTVDEACGNSVQNIATDKNMSVFKKTGGVDEDIQVRSRDGGRLLNLSWKRNGNLGIADYSTDKNKFNHSHEVIKTEIHIEDADQFEGLSQNSDLQETHIDSETQTIMPINEHKDMDTRDSLKSKRKQQPTNFLKKTFKKPVKDKSLLKKAETKIKYTNCETISEPFKLEDHPNSYSVESYTDLARVVRQKSDEEKQCKRFLCKICNSYRTVMEENLKQHIQLHVNGKLDCKTCSFIADSTYNLRYHINENHQLSESAVVCELCGAVKGSSDSYKTHASKVHGIAAFSCSHCEKSFHKQQDLKMHLFSAHESVAFQCDKCKGIYMSQSGLDYHMKHCTEKLIKCKYCSCVRNSKKSMSIHVRTTHAKASTYKCSICTFSGTTKQQLANHMNAHLGIHEYSCDLCDFSCVKKYQLESHKRRHTGERKFKCDKCCYAAAWNVQLKNHMKAHESETQCVCKECGIVLKDQSCLKRHKLKEHTMHEISV